jgi:DNA polymerase III epsilon subunit-like protein
MSQNHHVMLDLETWGTGPDAAIVSIGACIFVPTTDEIVDRFHVAIDPVSNQEFGRKTDALTILWWMHSDRDVARKRWLDADKVDLWTALEGFGQWCPNAPVWGNGATFDNVILSSAYKTVGLDQPWKFWHDRCYRTLKGLAPAIKLVREGDHHDALDDAVSQAKHMQAIVAHLGLDV